MNDNNLELYCKSLFQLELSIFSANQIISKLKKEYNKRMIKVTSDDLGIPKPDKPCEQARIPFPVKPVYDDSKINSINKISNPTKKLTSKILRIIGFSVIVFIVIMLILIIQASPVSIDSIIVYLKSIPVSYILTYVIISLIGGIALSLLFASVKKMYIIYNYKKRIKEYKHKISEWELEYKEIEEKNQKLKEDYQKELKEYNDKLNNIKKEVDSKNKSNFEAANIVIISKIKLMIKCIEDSRKVLDVLYQQNNVSVEYRDIVPVYAFCNYLNTGRYESFDGDGGLIAAYNRDYYNNLIPTAEKIQNVIAEKVKITELVDDLDSKLKYMTDINQEIRFKINAYVKELNKYTENIAEKYNINQRY